MQLLTKLKTWKNFEVKNATECKIYQGMVLHESDKVLPNMRDVPDVNI